jgi:RNA polymerase sigma-70 factor (ECF subfamily)
METDSELIRRAKEGDESAFGDVVKRYLSPVYAFLVRYSGETEVAEDATQETFVKAWKNLSRFDEARPLRPWLFKIARNSANDTLRKKRPTPFSRMFGGESEDDTAFEETVADEAPLQPELFEQKELTEMVRTALKELPERYRAVLLMRYEDNFSFDDIAYALSAPVNTVKSWHRRGLMRLREYLTNPASKYHHEA